MPRNQPVSENWLGDGVQGGYDLGEELNRSRVVRWKAIDDGVEAKGGKAREARENIGVASELALEVRGVEECNSDACY